MTLSTTTRTWLTQFPPPRRGPIANWFHAAAREGASTPAAVLDAVRRRHVRWCATDTDAALVATALAADPASALAYAQEVLAYEQLSYEERARLKEERAAHFRLEAMKRKPPSEAQLALIEKLNPWADEPHTMAEASALIDSLLEERGWA